MTQIPLTGLDGSNPLAFLAALGTFKTLSDQLSSRDFCLCWKSTAGRWQPVLYGQQLPSSSVISRYLAAVLRQRTIPGTDSMPKNLSAWKNEELRSFALSAAANCQPGDSRPAEFAAAYACDGLASDGDIIQDTDFRTLSGAGRMDFFPTLNSLQLETKSSHIDRALFSPWDYSDQRLSLRLDPIEDRRYALRADNPSGKPTQTMWGANRLAIEALPLFPTAPVNGHLATTGFTGTKSRDTYFTWPIRTTPIGLDVCRSLLALTEMQERQPQREILFARGIVEVFRSQRITVGKFRNFTPAQPV
jgi:hypothetical protein